MLRTAFISSVFFLSLSVHADFSNETRSPGQLISKSHPELGRLTTIDVLGNYVIAIPEAPSSPAEADFQVRALDISDPENPVTVGFFGKTQHPVLAHGTFKKGNQLYLGGWPNDTVRLEADGSLSYTKWSGVKPHWNHGGMFYPWGASHWWSYSEASGLAWLSLNGENTAEWDHLGETGVVGFPSFVGNILVYASDQSMSGIATYDVSDPSNPVLLDTFNLPDVHPKTGLVYGLGGYWSAVHSHYMVFTRRDKNPGVQIVDFSDPSNLRLHCEVLFKDPERNLGPLTSTLNPMYLNFQDEFVFAERLKINIDTCEVDLVLDELGKGVETSQYSRPIGNMLLTGGGPNYILRGRGIIEGGLGIWAHQAAPDTRAPYVAYHIPKDGQTNYPTNLPISLMIPETLHATTIIPGDTLRLQKVNGAEVPLDYLLNHTGMLTVRPLVELDKNASYRMTLKGIEDAVHNKMAEYSFTFSTGSNVNSNPPAISNVSVSPSKTLLLGDSITVAVTAADADGDNLQYRFRRSDGEDYSAWSNANTISLSYSTTGSHSISVQVRDTGNSTVSAVTSVSVVQSIYPGEPSLSSSRLALSASADAVWAVNPDNNSVTKLSTADSRVLGEFPVGTYPASVAIDKNQFVWVALRHDDAVAILDSNGNRVETIQLDYGSAPVGIVMDREAETAYIALHNAGEVVKFDTVSRQETARVSGLVKPYAMALSGAGNKLLVTRLISANAVGQVYQINPASMRLSSTIELSMNMVPDDIDDGRGLPNYLTSIVIDAIDKSAYVVSKKDNIGAGFVNNNADLDDDNSIRTLVARIDLLTGREMRSERIDLDNADSPSGIAIASNGNYVYITQQGNNKVNVLKRNPDTGQLSPTIGHIEVGLAPRGLLMDARNEKLFVKNFTERTVSTIDASDLLVGNIANPPVQTTTTVSSERLSDQVLLGQKLFYNASRGLNENGELIGRMSAEGYLSCASCHLDGFDDGVVYDFTGRNEGIRNNISLVGRSGTRFGRVHWSANFDEIHDFENDMRYHQRGRGFMSDEAFADSEFPLGNPKAGLSPELDALAAYVSSLGKASLPRSPYREASGELTGSALAGQQVFEQAGCSDCHRGKAFTDGITHDVGTLRGYSGSRLGSALETLSTPSLLGAFYSPPYLHDGSASTFEDVFSIIGGETIQAETAELTAGATVVSPEFSYMRAGQGVELDESGTISTRVSSEAHTGSVRVRYGSASVGSQLQLAVNNVEYTQPLIPAAMVDGEHVAFTEAVFTVDLSPGDNQLSVGVSSAGGNATVVIDDFTVSTAEAAQAAAVHTQVQSLSDTDKNNLLSYLQQIDQRSAPEDDEDIVLGAIVAGGGDGNGGAGGDSSGNNGSGSSGSGQTGWPFTAVLLLLLIHVLIHVLKHSSNVVIPGRRKQ